MPRLFFTPPALFLATLLAIPASPARAATLPFPTVLDSRLELDLVAANPEIVTPIGLAVDRRGRIFVVESNTHERPANYHGPSSDRILVFRPDPITGRASSGKVFAEGFRWAMNLAFSPRRELYLTHRDGVVRWRSVEASGAGAAPETILHLETAETYPHNGIGGIAFSPDGWLYVGMGENMGKDYVLKGSDGSACAGGGEGGNIFRCRPDGAHLKRYATGFWNPFGLEFDGGGRLFAVDNDPDERPPCRLLHVIAGGNYGYQFRYGRSGLHPYVSWDGELPGTLPMVAGTGEAPCGILEARQARLPAEYQQSLLVTSWGDHAIERYRLEPNGASFRSSREVIVQGGPWFRPVAIASGPDGSIYFSDWVDRSYPVHGKGRIWRLKVKPGAAGVIGGEPAPNPAFNASQELSQLASGSDAEFDSLKRGLQSGDPFVRSAAVTALSRPVWRPRLDDLLRDPDPALRLGALLSLRRSKPADAQPIVRQALADPDPQIRIEALIWTGESALTVLSPDLRRALAAGQVSRRLFEVYLATGGLLRIGGPARLILGREGVSGAELALDFARDESHPASLRALALSLLPSAVVARNIPLLATAAGAQPDLRRQAIFALAESPAAGTNRQAAAILEKAALDRTLAPDLRAEAMLGLSWAVGQHESALRALLRDPSPAVTRAAARALRPLADSSAVRQALLAQWRQLARQNFSDRALTEELALGLNLPEKERAAAGLLPRPESLEAWKPALAAPGNSAAGRLIFFGPLAGCVKCHTVQQHGGKVGPDLSAIGNSSTREKLMESILEPSREIAPDYVQQQVETSDGQMRAGVMAGRAGDGSLLLETADAGLVTIPESAIVSIRTSALSLMPEGLANAMTAQDFRDLLSFLQSLTQVRQDVATPKVQ